MDSQKEYARLCKSWVLSIKYAHDKGIDVLIPRRVWDLEWQEDGIWAKDLSTRF